MKTQRTGHVADFSAFRIALADKLDIQPGTITHIVQCKAILLRTSCEPHCLFFVSATPPHCLYEDFYLEDQDDFRGFDDWYEEEGNGFFRDWLIDMHPGLCPEHVVTAIDEIIRR